MKKQVKFGIAFLLLTAVIGAALYTVLFTGEEEEQYIYKEETVSKGTLFQGVTESGFVELETQVQKYSLNLETEEEDDGEEEEEAEKYLRIEDCYITPGQKIQQGDTVFKLTDKSVSDVGEKLREEAAEAKISLAEAGAEYELEALGEKHDYDTSTLNGSLAETAYQNSTLTLQKQLTSAYGKISVLEEERKELVLKQEDEEDWQNCEDLKEACEEAEKALEKCEESRLPKYIELRNTYLQAKEAYEKAKEERDSISEQIDEKNEEILEQGKAVRKLQQEMEKSSLTVKQEYEAADLDGALAEEIYSYSIESLKTSVETARTKQEEAAAKLEAFDTFVGDGIIYAEAGGLVTEVNYEEGDYLTNEGKMFSYAGEDNYMITVDISEEDIPDISVGDKVQISFTAYENEKYDGTVIQIVTDVSSEHAATVSYPVKVQIEGNVEKLYGGMPGDVTFVTDKAEEVLYVSKKAVWEKDGKEYVYVPDKDGNPTAVLIETGFSDGVSVQIAKGVTEGQTVLIESKISASQAENGLQKGMESNENGRMD